MKTLEGIIIKKAPTKARDLICQLLLRSGQTISIYCYGGQGGGRHHKGSILEIGHMIKVQVTPQKKYVNSDMPSSRDWGLIWESSLIRKDINAFYFMCFVFEIASKIATSHNIHEDNEMDHHEGLFNVVSNALFFLDQEIKKINQADINTHLGWFMTKLMGHMGITPDSDHCVHCHTELKNIGSIFEVQHGGFTCVNCLEKAGEYISQNDFLRRQIQEGTMAKKLMEQIGNHPYKDFELVRNQSKEVAQLLFNHLCYQFHMKPTDFKTKSTLF